MMAILGTLKEHALNVEQRLWNEALDLVDSIEIDECEAKHGKLEYLNIWVCGMLTKQ